MKEHTEQDLVSLRDVFDYVDKKYKGVVLTVEQMEEALIEAVLDNFKRSRTKI